MSRYSAYDVDSDEKKQDCFRQGLNPGLRYAVSNVDYESFQKLVDKVFVMEKERKGLEEDRKRRMVSQGSPSNARPRYSPYPQAPMNRFGGQQQQQYQQRSNYQSPASKPQYQQQQRPMQQQQRPVYQQQQQQRPAIQQQPQQQQNRTGQVPNNIGPCFSCGQHGHLANNCPKKGQAPVQNQQNRQGVPPRPPAHQNQLLGRVHHMTAEEAQNEPDVILGMFPVESSFATVLFDSGASHSFISASFVAQNNLCITLMRDLMVVSTPSGKMHTRNLCPKVRINIRGVDFLSSLIVLDSGGLDIILGMDWLVKYKGIIDCATKSI